jgi:hypothetical protein
VDVVSFDLVTKWSMNAFILREALSMFGVWDAVPSTILSLPSHETAHRRPSIQLQGVWQDVSNWHSIQGSYQDTSGWTYLQVCPTFCSLDSFLLFLTNLFNPIYTCTHYLVPEWKMIAWSWVLLLFPFYLYVWVLDFDSLVLHSGTPLKWLYNGYEVWVLTN